MRRLAPFAPLAPLAALVLAITPSAAAPDATSSSSSSSGATSAIATWGAPAPSTMRIADLPIPGPAPFVAVARDVVDAAVAVDPSVAADAGLFDDAARVPSYSPRAVAALVARLDADLAALRAMPWRSWSVDEQIDARWVAAYAETLRHQVAEERPYAHRAAEWLEPVGNALVALVSYAPERADLQRRMFAQLPAMLDEVRAVATEPTRRDVETARQLVDAIAGMAEKTGGAEAQAAARALARYRADLQAARPAAEFHVVGAASYAWRYRHALLFPWTPTQLLARAEQALADVDAELSKLEPRVRPSNATPAQREAARALTRDGMLSMYDGVERSLRAATSRGRWVTIPDFVGPIRARETPDAEVPLTGDGGSMDPPPTYVASNVGLWNVEHFHADWSEEARLDIVTSTQAWAKDDLGPYAAHEGFPGHHLQLSIARKNPDPLRSVLRSSPQIEGWALYAEEALFDHGGLGRSPEARRAVLRSLRHRIARVVWDVRVETGEWDLQRAADFKRRTAPGQGKIDEDVLRTIQWPTQLVSYWGGKLAIVELRDETKRKLGARFDERSFHDRLLAEGSIPLALVRAKMLGEPVPPLD